MESFIKSPNLPLGKVSLGVVDGRARKTIIKSLQELGIKVITTDRCRDLYDAVSYHPDMFIHHLGGDCIIAAPNAPAETISQLKEYGFNIITGKKPISGKYPDDIAYNVARIEDYAICNTKYTDETLLNYLIESGVRIINIKQGYSKCSICIVDRGAVITSDEGIYRDLKKHDFDILKITPGHIGLKGLNYGFIGGATGLISRNTLAFAGNIALHPDFKKINKFLLNHGKYTNSLDGELLTDIGTFIPLKEYCSEELC